MQSVVIEYIALRYQHRDQALGLSHHAELQAVTAFHILNKTVGAGKGIFTECD